MVSVSNTPSLAVLAGQTAPDEVQLLIGHPRRVGIKKSPPTPVVVELKHLDVGPLAEHEALIVRITTAE